MNSQPTDRTGHPWDKAGGTRHGSTAYLSHVDGLRAVAILSVLGFHAAPSLVPGGFVGVDVFFVISGFLITSVLRNEMTQGTFSLKDFLARRARRIVPALAFVVLFTVIAAGVILTPEQMSEFGKSLTATGLFGANIHFYRTTDYFALEAQERPLLHTWSLAIEEQFYIVWPLLLVVLTTWLSRKAALALIGGAILASLALFLANASGNDTYAFYMPQCRAWELLVGAMLALTVDGIALSRKAAQTLAVVGIGSIAISAFVLSEAVPHPGIATLVATIGTAAVILACNGQATVVGRGLSLRPIVWIGLISYSLYLWHWPVLTFAKLQSPSELSALMIVALVLVSAALAWFSWRYVETPFRGKNGELRLPARTALAGAAGLLVVIAGVGLSMELGRGWPWRLDAPSRAVYAQMANGNPLRKTCDGVENIFGSDDDCGFGRERRTGESYDVAVFGDSHADHFVPMVARLAAERGLSGRQVTQSTCAPLIGVWRPRPRQWREETCVEYQKGMLAFVAANPNLKLAILSANWLRYQGALGHNGLDPDKAMVESRTSSPYALMDFLEPTVRYLSERGVTTLILGAVPQWKEAGKLPIECAIDAKRQGADKRACGISAAATRQRLAVSNETIREVAARVDNVSKILGTDLTCDGRACYAMMDGVFLYRNPGHLNKIGAETLAKYVTLPPLAGSNAATQAKIDAPGVAPRATARE